MSKRCGRGVENCSFSSWHSLKFIVLQFIENCVQKSEGLFYLYFVCSSLRSCECGPLRQMRIFNVKTVASSDEECYMMNTDEATASRGEIHTRLCYNYTIYKLTLMRLYCGIIDWFWHILNMTASLKGYAQAN